MYRAVKRTRVGDREKDGGAQGKGHLSHSHNEELRLPIENIHRADREDLIVPDRALVAG